MDIAKSSMTTPSAAAAGVGRQDLIRQLADPDSVFYQDMLSRIRQRAEEQEEQKREDAIVEAFGRVIDAMNSKDDGPKRPGMGKSFTELLRSIGELDPDDPERIRLEQMVKRLQELGIWFDLPGLDQEDGEEETLTQLLTEMRVKDFQAEI